MIKIRSINDVRVDDVIKLTTPNFREPMDCVLSTARMRVTEIKENTVLLRIEWIEERLLEWIGSSIIVPIHQLTNGSHSKV